MANVTASIPWLSEDTDAVQWMKLLAQRDEELGLKWFSVLSHLAFIWPLVVMGMERVWYASSAPYEAPAPPHEPTAGEVPLGGHVSRRRRLRSVPRLPRL